MIPEAVKCIFDLLIMSTCARNMFEDWSKIFRTDALKIIKLTIRPIGRRHLRSSSLPHVDTGPIVSSIFGTLPGSPFLSEHQALLRFGLDLLNGIESAFFSFNLISEIGRSHRVPNQGSTVGGGEQQFCFSPETGGRGRKCETGRCHGEAARSVLAKVGGGLRTFSRSLRKTSQ